MAAPIHILMLPSGASGIAAALPGAASSRGGGGSADAELKSFLRENEGDYLDRRNRILRKQGRPTDGGSGPPQDGGGNPAAAAAKNGATFSPSCDDLWSGSSPLEMAIAACCDHDGLSGDSEGSGAGSAYRCGAVRRGNEGRFASLIARHCHTAGDRALALAVLQRTMERDEAVSKMQREQQLQVGKRSEEQQLSGTTSRLASAAPFAASAGVAAPDKQNESPSAVTPALNAKLNAEGFDASERADADKGDGGNGFTGAANSSADCHRISNFLSAGGLKVLNQWLIDAFTPVLVAPAQPPKERARRRKPPKDEEGPHEPTTSPTGPILLPLLSILQNIPFNMELVMDSQINKQIKKLKKNLDRLVANFEEEESESDSESNNEADGDVEGKSKSRGQKKAQTLEELIHPVSGGIPVVQVQKDVERLMQTWKVAASDRKSSDGEVPGAPAAEDFYGELRVKMEERLLALSRFERGEAEKPPWLEKIDPTPPTVELKSSPQVVAATLVAGSASVKKRQEERVKRQSEASRRLQQQQAELKAAQAARQEAREKMEQYRKRMMLRAEGSMLKKRKVEAAASTPAEDRPTEKKLTPTLRVTWADQKAAGAKLVEVREFVRETDVYQSEEEEKRGQDSDDESDEKFEEEDFENGEYDDETQASDSVDSDDFDGIMNEKDANFSQEEEAGFTFETQELSRGKGGKVIQLNKNLDSDEDGWESFTCDI